MKKIAVVMTYFDRQFQLNRTLKSIAQTKHNNFEVIVVDDSSEEPPEIGLCSYQITVLRTNRKVWTNPEPAYNLGIQQAINKGAEIIVVQNAECYHVNDIILHAANVTNERYFTYGCFSIDADNTFATHDITALLMANELGASRDGQNAWYNHSKFRPVAYDFCAAITIENMIKLNGYDERFSLGCGYGDDYFLARIKAMGLTPEIIDNPFVVHQWHYNGVGVPEDKGNLVAKNKALFACLTPPDNIKAKHYFIPDFKPLIN